MLLYHATLTRKVSRIKRQGLRRFQTSNWVRAGNGERHGSGEIFAFTDRQDALRWAAKMDWHLYQKTGSGEVSIVTFNAQPERWIADDSDPLSQAGRRGFWLKSEYPVEPLQIIGAILFDARAVAAMNFTDLLHQESTQ